MRKTAQYKVTDEGRDKGKLFLITEMTAEAGESWAMRVLLALMNSGANVDIPHDFAQLGMAGLAQMGLKALTGLKWEQAEPLLREMMGCVQIIPDPHKPAVVRDLLEANGAGADIEEISTRFKLRAEVWKLHMGFLAAVAPSLSEKLRGAAGRASVTKTSAK